VLAYTFERGIENIIPLLASLVKRRSTAETAPGPAVKPVMSLSKDLAERTVAESSQTAAGARGILLISSSYAILPLFLRSNVVY